MVRHRKGLTHLFTDFAPRLKQRGVADADLKVMLRDNPRRLPLGRLPF